MFGSRLGGSLAGWGERRTKAQTLAEHWSALKELKDELSRDIYMHVPNMRSRKPASTRLPPAIDSCCPILINDMAVDEVHKGRVLKGRLITEAIKMQSVQSVLEDAAGDAVTVHIYNVPSLPAVVTTIADLKKAQAMFPEGQQIAVIEPFYKLMRDGTYGVRVDNPAEVLFLDSDGQCLHNAAEKTGQASPGGLPPDLEAQLEVLEALDDLAELTSALAQSARPDVQGRSFASKPRRPNKSKKRSNKAKGKQR